MSARSTGCPTGQRQYVNQVLIEWGKCGIKGWGVKISNPVLSMLGLDPNTPCRDCVKEGYQNGEIILSACCDPPNMVRNPRDRECRRSGHPGKYKIRKCGYVRIANRIARAFNFNPSQNYTADMYVDNCWIILTNIRPHRPQKMI